MTKLSQPRRSKTLAGVQPAVDQAARRASVEAPTPSPLPDIARAVRLGHRLSPSVGVAAPAILQRAYGDQLDEVADPMLWWKWAYGQRSEMSPRDVVDLLQDTLASILSSLSRDGNFAESILGLIGKKEEHQLLRQSALQLLGLPPANLLLSANPAPRSTSGEPAEITEKTPLYDAPPTQVEIHQFPARVNEEGIELDVEDRILVKAENPGNSDWVDVEVPGKTIGVTLGCLPKTCYQILPGPYQYATIDQPLYGLSQRPQIKDVRQGDLGDCYLLSALISITQSNPGAITGMIQPFQNDYAVRFYNKVQNSYTPDWIRVDKQLVVAKQGGGAAFAAHDQVLWPGLIEKAYTIFLSRRADLSSYAFAAASKPEVAFRAILGADAQKVPTPQPAEVGVQEPNKKPLYDGNPMLMNEQLLLQRYGLEKELAQIFILERKKADPGIVADLPLASQLATQVLEGRNDIALGAMLTYFEHNFEGAMSSGKYSQRAFQHYQAIVQALFEQKPVVANSQDAPSSGNSSNRETELATGLVGPHAYAVTGTRGPDKKKLYWVKLRNPHGDTPYTKGRGYSQAMSLWFKLNVKEINESEFELELSDLMRYFQSVSFG